MEKFRLFEPRKTFNYETVNNVNNVTRLKL